MRQNIKIRSLLLVSGLVVFSVLATLFSVSENGQEVGRELLDETLSRYVSSAAETARVRLENLDEEIDRTKLERKLGLSSRIQLIARYEFLQGSNTYRLDWTVGNSKAVTPQTDLKTALDKIKPLTSWPEQTSLVRNIYPDGRPLFTAVRRDEKGAWVALLKDETLDGITMPFKGGIASVFLVDARGIVLSHPLLAYRGVSFENHPVVSEILKSKKKLGHGKYEDLESRSVLAHYQSIENREIYAVATAPAKILSGMSPWSSGTLIVIMGLLLVGGAITITFSRRVQTEVAEDYQSAEEVRTQEVENHLKNILEEKDALAIEAQREAQVRLAKGVSNSLRGLLSGILGHIQILKEKTEGREDLKKHTDFLERETRLARSLIDDLSLFSGADHIEGEPIDLYDAVVAYVENVSHGLNRKGIEIVRELMSAPSVKGLSHQITKALEDITIYVANHMYGRGKVTIKLEQEEGMAELKFIFEGADLGEINDTEMFEPFSCKVSVVAETGLELSAAWGVIKAHGGDIQVISDEEKLMILISLPVSEARAKNLLADKAHLGDLTFIESPPVKKKSENSMKSPSILPDAPEVVISPKSEEILVDLDIPEPTGMENTNADLVRAPRLEIT